MPKYTKQALLDMKDAVNKLADDVDSLIESRDELELLSDKEKNQLIFHMLANHDDLKNLSHVTDALRNPTLQTDQCFHAKFSRALEVCRRLDSITDKRNNNPGRLFIGNEFNADLYNECATLVQHRLAGKEELVAQCLGNSPLFNHGEIAKKLEILSAHPTGDVFKTINAKFGKIRDARVAEALSHKANKEEQVELLDGEHHTSTRCCVLI